MIPRGFAAAVIAPLLSGQTYDLLLKGGHVLDHANNIDGVLDVAISGNRIVRVAPGIPAKESRKSVDAAGLYVTPGLVDLHGHVYVRGRPSALFPDDSALTAGTTTVCDAGISGWRTFDDFKATIIDKSKTRVLAFVRPSAARQLSSRQNIIGEPHGAFRNAYRAERKSSPGRPRIDPSHQ